MNELSPAAQALLNAYWLDVEAPPWGVVADVLCAVADEVIPEDELYARSCCEFTGATIRKALLDLAEELRNYD